MQKALPYRAWPPASGSSSAPPPISGVRKAVAENAVAIFAKKGCCMCHVVKLLLHGHGVNPTILQVDDQNEADVSKELAEIIGKVDGSGKAVAAPQFPAVFVGGELVGGLEDVMGAHISGELVPRLRKAGAIWL